VGLVHLNEKLAKACAATYTCPTEDAALPVVTSSANNYPGVWVLLTILAVTLLAASVISEKVFQVTTPDDFALP